ncbi:MAG TPA: TIGR00730 family Rossman fold protein, partial [Allosphingosinicella sp.]
MKRLAVYCGASMGADPLFERVARELGAEMARRRIDLVYGGGHRGLMGVVADSVLAEGGRAYGVIPKALVDLEVAHTGL